MIISVLDMGPGWTYDPRFGPVFLRKSPMALIGTQLVEDLVQSVAFSHLVADRDRVGLLLLAAPESGKTTIATAASCDHVKRIVVITARSIMQLTSETEIEFLLFNDLSVVRSLSKATSALLINTLNQVTQGETGEAMFAGQERIKIERQLGVIGCMPFKLFTDRRAHWRNMGFVSRMLPFAYSYDAELIATIKNSVDRDRFKKAEPRAMPVMKHNGPVHVSMNKSQTNTVRSLADARASTLDQIGIRLLKNYHTLIRAHAIRHGRTKIEKEDLDFLRQVDGYISITDCKAL